MQQDNYNIDYIDPTVSGPERKNQDNSTKKKEEKKNDNDSFSRISSFFENTKMRIFFGTTLGLLTTYLLIVLISFLVSGGVDQSRVVNSELSELTKEADNVSNVGSAFGANLANLLMADGVGFAALILVIWGGILSFRLLSNKKIHFFSFSFISLISMFTFSILIGSCELILENVYFFPLGGNFGKYSSKFLLDFAGVPGLVIIDIIIALLWILLCYNTLARLLSGIKKVMPRKVKPEEYEVSPETEEAIKSGLTEFGHESETIDADADDKNNTLQEVPVSAPTPLEELKPIDVKEEPKQEKKLDVVGKFSEENGLEKGTVTKAKDIEKADSININAYDPTKELSKYKYPTIDLLREVHNKVQRVDINELEENKKRITETLNNYGIPIKQIDACVGPTITLFEIIPADGVRISRIKNLEDDIALSLAALGIRIIAPIPGRGTIGIEVPNKEPQTVSMRSVIESKKFQECKYDLPMALGCTISNEVFIADLAKMPHLLVAGATGQGKSVGLNAIITSLLYKKHPSELKFVLVDPKMVEFSLYGILEHHYLAKLPEEDKCIITDSKKVVATLNSLVAEMENRYKLLSEARVRTVKDYNKKFINRELNPEKGHYYMPYIVVIIDEFCDLIMEAGKDVEAPIVRIAQKARAVGIHAIIATQRPSTNVITGIIKANFPGRIAFRVTQMVDSRTILDCSGAQQLVGKGDMLFSANGNMERIQCAFVDTPEVERICEYIGNQVGYEEAYELPPYVPEDNGSDGSSSAVNLNDRDSLFEEAAAFIITGDTASTSSLQRRYGIGYNRAGRIMDQLEAAGIVGPSQGGKPRKVLMDSIQLTQVLSK